MQQRHEAFSRKGFSVKNFTAADIYRHRVVSSIQGSRQTPRVVFLVKRARRKPDGYSRRLWHIDTNAGRISEPLTLDRYSATSPCLSTDGTTLAFLSARDKKMRVHLLKFSGGEARPLSKETNNTISSIECWSTDGKRLLVSASVEWIEDGEHKPSDGSRGPQVVRYLPYKQDGTGITVGERTHLYAVDAVTGELSALTKGDYDVKHGTWSPDDQQLAWVRNRSGQQRHRQELWVSAADGSDPRLLCDALASIESVSWSPAGRHLAIVGSREDGDSRARAWLLDVGSGTLEPLSRDIEVEPVSAIVWHMDGERVAFVASERGLRTLRVLSLATGHTVRIDSGLRHVLEIAASGERLAFVAASMRRLCELFSVDWDGGDERRHSSFNRRWTRERVRPRAMKRRFVVPDGKGGDEKVEAWLLRPAVGEGPFPLLVDFHGGPHSVALIDFDAHAYWYDLCSRGWAVLAVNPAGSGSYGDEFAYRLRSRWGELDLPQIAAIVGQLQDSGLADQRVACTGKSYGGFLSAWAIGHSHLFRAAVVCAPVANITSHAGTSDTGYYVTPFAMGADLNDDPELYQRLSPIGACKNATAATLILQGENDGRCPRGQSEELFAHLVRCGSCVVELVIYPGNTHAVAEGGPPSHRLDYHQRLADWVDHHVARSST
jgi:dipeptidyl aminopeptidase/acylaminoacyl peptidase